MPLQRQKALSTNFGDRIFALRRRRRLKQKEVADAAKLDASYLASIETGRRPPPQNAVLNRLMTALRATPEERSEIQAALIVDRLARIIANEVPSFSYAPTLVRLAACLPYRTLDEINALEALIERYGRSDCRYSKEVAM